MLSVFISYDFSFGKEDHLKVLFILQLFLLF